MVRENCRSVIIVCEVMTTKYLRVIVLLREWVVLLHADTNDVQPIRVAHDNAQPPKQTRYQLQLWALRAQARRND